MFADSDNGGGTDWSQKSVPEMWSMLAAHDGTAHKDLLLTWLQSADLLIDHLSRVKRYRDNLAEAWPPDKSQAAARYLDRLDDLITHLTSTYYAAVENHRALGAATSALVGARLKLEHIYREYLANQHDMNAYNQKLKTNEQLTGKYRIIAPTPPTAASRQLELQLQAQSVMSSLSTDLAQAQLAITTPKPYAPSNPVDERTPFKKGGPESTQYTEPSSSTSFNNSNTALSKNSFSTSTPSGNESTYSPTPYPNAPGYTPSNQLSGPPTLSGLEPSTISSPPTIPSTPTEPPDSTIGGFNSPAPPELGIPTAIGGSGPSASAPGNSIRDVRGSTSGGIIGATPGTETTRNVTNLPTTQRINPTGGVIGQPSHSGMPLIPSQRRKATDESTRPENRWDPDSPWAIEEGVAPIVLPPEKKKIDPGPVIGLP